MAKPTCPAGPTKPKTPMPMPKKPKRFLDAIAALLCVGALVAGLGLVAGCFPGADPHAVIDTSAGPREAGTVWTQDAVGDVLDFLKKAQLEAVKQYQAIPLAERSEKQRQALLSSQAAIRAGYDGLIAWKKLPSGGGPDQVLYPMKPFANDVLDLLEHTGAIPPEKLAVIKAFLAPIFGAAGGGR